jgi:ATP-dependent RNA helicase DeaD
MSQATPGFADLALAAPVLDALQRIGYEQPSPIQAESIPHLLNGHDLLGTAQTGTGKTAAFALPLLSRLDLSKTGPQVLVLAPTRELAIQVAEAFQTYAGAMKGFHVLPIYGGQTMDGQLRQLRRGVHVVVGTPGRVMDHLRRGTLKLNQLQTVVLDEADEMLRMGFIDDVTWILEHTPESRQVALFSATMPKPIRRVADQYLKDPKVVKIHTKTATVDSIEQHYWTVSGVNKLDALTRMLEVEDFDGIIMFVRTKTLTVELADKLEARGYSAGAINGDMTQTLRERTIAQLKSSKIDILVATDVAARGIDVTRISHVINYDIPYDTEAYVHRIGRTGRAGRSGKAILFVAPRERRLLRAIEKATGQSITAMELPSREQVNQKRISQFKETVFGALENDRLEFFHNLVQECLDESSVDPQQLAGALAYLAQKDNPLVLKESSRKERRENSEQKKDRSSVDKKRKPKTQRDHSADDANMEYFRLAVGHNHKAKPGDIVAAIANEAGIDGEYIGRIELHDEYSTVGLPADMPDEVFNQLKTIYVRNQPLQIEKLGKKPPSSDRKRKPKKAGAKSAKSKAPHKRKANKP